MRIYVYYICKSILFNDCNPFVGEDPTHQDSLGFSAIDYARNGGYRYIAETLEKASNNSNRNSENDTNSDSKKGNRFSFTKWFK